MTAPGVAARRWTSDTLWNYAAFALTALVGAVVHLGIASALGAGVLGVFVQLYAVHVVGAQIAVLGVHDSVQKHVAEYVGRAEPTDGIVVGGSILVLISAGTLAVVVALVADGVGVAVGSSDVGRGLLLVAPGLVAFALNKVLFAALNGSGRLRHHAFGQMARALLVLAAFGALVGFGLPGWCVGGILPAAEIGLLPILLWLARPSVRRARGLVGEWLARHLRFGALGAINGVLLETHLRVDVLVLSFFVSDSAVGAYGFAALFAEGLYQVPVVIRSVAFPTLVQHASFGTRRAVTGLVRRLAVASAAASVLGAALIWAAYPLLSHFFSPELVADGQPVLRVLLIAVALYGAFVPFDQLLLQSGFPGRQSVLMASYVATNVVLNLLFIPRFGLIGAAYATACSFFVGAVLLLVASWKWLGYRRGVLFYDASR